MNFIIDKNLYYFGIYDSDHTFLNTTVTKKRLVDCYEIEIYDQNGGTTYINEKPYEIRAGKIICSKPGDYRYSKLPLKTYYLKISDGDTDIQRFLKTLEPEMQVSDTKAYTCIIDEMLFSFASNDTFARHSGFFKILSLLKNDFANHLLYRSCNDQPNADTISNAIKYIESNYYRKCTLKDIAKAVHLTPVYFHGVFKKAIGKTPYEFLESIRIGKAKKMLISSNVQSTDFTKIASDCGFSSQSYFNHAFKRVTGMTPGEYQKRCLNMYYSHHGKRKPVK